jgi:fructokinase
MNHVQYMIVGLGELLWDVFTGGRQLGGAPTNFAYVSRLLGDRAVVASRVGSDELGQEALGRLERLGLTARYVQRDDRRPTGTVKVDVDEKGQPSFTCTADAAWDYLEWTPQWEELAAEADAVCFGSLAQRSAQSRATIQQFLQRTRPDALRVFDVNLRHSGFSAEHLSRSLELARVVKLNSEELPRVAEMLKLGGRGEHAFANRLIQVFDLELVAITRGERGSVLVTGEEMLEHPGLRVAVADTVGAGDAFAAALVHYHLRRAPLEQMSEAANRMGAWVATQVGATPSVGSDTLDRILANVENH